MKSMEGGPEKIDEEYIKRRASEEGLDVAEEYREDLDYVEGRKKLFFVHGFSSGGTLEATENKGEAKFVIKKDGKELFDFKSLVPSDFKLVTPEYWLKLNDRDESAPADFRVDPERHRSRVKYSSRVQGRWAFVDKYISIGSVSSLKDVFSLLHEIGHLKRNEDGLFSEIDLALNEGNNSRANELLSESERMSWAEALKMARKIDKDTGIDLFEDFSSTDDIKKYIYTYLSTHRYTSELRNVSSLGVMSDILGIYSLDKNLKWLDKLFDKRKLTKNSNSNKQKTRN